MDWKTERSLRIQYIYISFNNFAALYYFIFYVICVSISKREMNHIVLISIIRSRRAVITI